jgi:hypothetical protein
MYTRLSPLSFGLSIVLQAISQDGFKGCQASPVCGKVYQSFLKNEPIDKNWLTLATGASSSGMKEQVHDLTKSIMPASQDATTEDGTIRQASTSKSNNFAGLDIESGISEEKKAKYQKKLNAQFKGKTRISTKKRMA